MVSPYTGRFPICSAPMTPCVAPFPYPGCLPAKRKEAPRSPTPFFLIQLPPRDPSMITPFTFRPLHTILHPLLPLNSSSPPLPPPRLQISPLLHTPHLSPLPSPRILPVLSYTPPPVAFRLPSILGFHNPLPSFYPPFLLSSFPPLFYHTTFPIISRLYPIFPPLSSSFVFPLSHSLTPSSPFFSPCPTLFLLPPLPYSFPFFSYFLHLRKVFFKGRSSLSFPPPLCLIFPSPETKLRNKSSVHNFSY